MKLRVYDMQDGVTKLGPGTRFVLWTQGCPRACKGCMSPESQNIHGGYDMDVEELANKIISANREGMTISGGDPFLQAEAVAQLIECIRADIDQGVILYTGYTLEELKNMHNKEVDHLLSCIDLLIDGPYIEEYNDGKSLRGSSNQRVIPLTDRYLNEMNMYGTEEASAEFFMREDGMIMVGVPGKQMLENLQKQFK